MLIDMIIGKYHQYLIFVLVQVWKVARKEEKSERQFGLGLMFNVACPIAITRCMLINIVILKYH